MVSNESASRFKWLHDNREGAYELNNLRLNTPTWDPIMAYLIAQKLDSESIQLFDQGNTWPEELPRTIISVHGF